MIFDINIILNDPFLYEKLLGLIKECMFRAKDRVKLHVEKKSDGTLVTQADKDINELISTKLKSLFPPIPIISEEGNINEGLFMKDFYWLIDPIDGTSSYVKGKNSYSINIALIYQGSPILGIIANPPTNTVWYGFREKALVLKNTKVSPIKTRTFEKSNCKLIVSNENDYKTNVFIKNIKGAKTERLSSSLKFCEIAEGNANLYPRLNSISKWDIAAGDAIVRAANGIVLNIKGENFNYRTPTVKTGEFFVLSTKIIWNDLIVTALQSIGDL